MAIVLDGVEHHHIKDIQDISARVPLLLFHGFSEVICKYRLVWLQREGGGFKQSSKVSSEFIWEQ